MPVLFTHHIHSLQNTWILNLRASDGWRFLFALQSAWDADDLVKQTVPVKVNDGYTRGDGGYSGGGYGE